MIQVVSQTFGEVFSEVPALTVPLPQVLFMVLLICLAAIFERYKLIMIMAYAFLLNWVFVYNPGFLSFDLASMITVASFLVLGIVAILTVFHQSLSR